MIGSFLMMQAAGIAAALACHPNPNSNGCPQPVYPQLASRSEWQASTQARSPAADAAIDVGSQGDSIVVWSGRRPHDGVRKSAVFLQRFDRQGIAIGGETQVSLWTQSDQIAPAIATSRSGIVWIVWQSQGQDGDGGSIIARRFENRTTDPVAAATNSQLIGGSEILINQDSLGDQTSPTVVVQPDGSAVFAWSSDPAASGHQQIRARIFDSLGEPAGDEFAVVANANHSASIPSIAVSADGSFAIAFALADEQLRPVGIALEQFGRCGERVAEPIAIAADAGHIQIEPFLAASNFGYVAAWMQTSIGIADYDVMTQRLDWHGRPLAAPIKVNLTEEGHRSAAAVAIAPDDRFFIAWNQQDQDESVIVVQSFNPAGQRLGQETRLISEENERAKAGEGVRDQSHHEKEISAMRPAAGTRRVVFSGAPNGDLLCAWNRGAADEDAVVRVSMLSAQPIDLHGGLLAQGVRDDIPVNETILAAAPGGGGAQPHEPPTFDPRNVGQGRRDIITGFTDIGFTAILNTGWTPPDSHMGVGPSNIVVMTNGAIGIFGKDGTLLSQQAIEGADGFWGSLGATNFVFDPEVLYDPLSGRFFAMASEGNAPGAKSYILIAISDDSDANGTWYKYRFETTALAGSVYDSPNIAVDASVIYITGDGGSGSYPVFTYDKASMLLGNPPALNQSFLMTTSTQSAGLPPVSFDAPPALYMIEHKEASSNTQVRLIALTNPLTAPTFTFFNLTVPAYGPPENPPQQGTTIRPTTFDARFWNVAYRNGSLWATHHINSARVLARWYEIAMNGWPTSGNNPSLVQSGTEDLGATVRTYFTAITVDNNNNAALTFARSSPTEFISMQTAYRSHNDPLGTFQTPIQRQINSGPYTIYRWGDYAAVEVDPADGHTMWAHHEYAAASVWKTWIQSFYPTPPCVADINGSGGVNVDDLLAVINAWGPCPAPPTPCPTDIAPAGGNGQVNVDDLLAVINAWGACP